MKRKYIAIDLKSFYASVECVERGLDPLSANLLVADQSRTDKTICLAVSPSLKAYGIPGRARLFEAKGLVDQANSIRRQRAPGGRFSGSSCDAAQLAADPSLSIDFITAPPRMSLYMKVSTQIYGIYLRYIAPEDIHVYSVDEVFIDATNYLETYKMTANQLAMKIVSSVLRETGITATAGIGTNLYLCKIAMDIVAKHMPPDKDGVRVAQLDEASYREQLWDHRPLTDFWRVGGGYTKKLASHGIYTMGDIARCSVRNEELLYSLFGVNAELLIDHAWGWEPCTIGDIKSYRPESRSLSLGQVLSTPYTYEKARIIVREMTELLVLDLVSRELVTDQMVLTVGYDTENLKNKNYTGEVTVDRYGRLIPKKAHGSENLFSYTSSTAEIAEAVMRLFDRIADKELLVRRVCVVANHTVYEKDAEQETAQLSLFSELDGYDDRLERRRKSRLRERSLQNAVIALRERYGKNSVLKGMNFLDGATTIERNAQIGGHRA